MKVLEVFKLLLTLLFIFFKMKLSNQNNQEIDI